MIEQVTVKQVRMLRLQAQGLTASSTKASIYETIDHLCALQSQEPRSAHLGIRARVNGLTEADIKHTHEVERSIVLTWTARGTMHLVPADDLTWQLKLFGAHFIRKTERRYRQLELDEATRHKAGQLMVKILSKTGPLNRAQLAQALAAKDIPVEGQATHHLLRYAALAGLICFGPEVNGEMTYVVLDDWLPSQNAQEINHNQALAELTHRYMGAFGPATPQDFISWSGLPAGQAKAGFKAIENDLVEVNLSGESAWMLKTQAKLLNNVATEPPSVRLLPRYDNYMLGHTRRSFMVDDEFAKQVHPGGGLIRSPLIVDGQAQAIWQLKRKRHHIEIALQPFTTIDPAIIPLIEPEVHDIGRFLEAEAKMTSLEL